MRTLLGSLALAVTTGLVGTALPADAGSLTVTDQTGDVSQGRVDLDGGYVYQSNIREGDFIATSFRHGPRAVVVTSRFRDLGRVGDAHLYFLRLQTGRKLYREVTVQAGPGGWRGVHVVTDRRGDRVRCAATHSIDYDRNVVTVRVPRSCLGDPLVVRGTAAGAWTQQDAQDPSQPDYVQVDNPHDTDTEANTWTRWIRHG